MGIVALLALVVSTFAGIVRSFSVPRSKGLIVSLFLILPLLLHIAYPILAIRHQLPSTFAFAGSVLALLTLWLILGIFLAFSDFRRNHLKSTIILIVAAAVPLVSMALLWFNVIARLF